MTTDSTTVLTAAERATMRATVGNNAARLEAARRERITGWQEKMAAIRERLVAGKTDRTAAE